MEVLVTIENVERVANVNLKNPSFLCYFWWAIFFVFGEYIM
jgi:hypothetical protein